MRVHVKDNEKSMCSIVQRWRWILVFRLVASLGKYAFIIQNACLFVDRSIENGINSILEKWRIIISALVEGSHKSSH